MLSSIILSGGESKRFGYPKALIKDKVTGKNFINILLEKNKSLSIRDIVVVVGAHSKEIMEQADLSGAKVVVNENWTEGQISSLRKGISALDKKSEGFILNPVDCPYVKIRTYRLLINSWQEDKTKIHIPVYAKKGGHPAIFPLWSYEILLKENLPGGAKSLFTIYPTKLARVKVDDPAIADDIDTEANYEKTILRRKMNAEDFYD